MTPRHWQALAALALMGLGSVQALPAAVSAAQPPAIWNFRGRQVERRSTSRTELLLGFTLRPGEDPVAAVKGCVQTTRAQYPAATYVYCAAYTPAAFGVLSGKLRLCSSVNLHWFSAETGTPETLRLNLAGDDPRFPKNCPAPALPAPPPRS